MVTFPLFNREGSQPQSRGEPVESSSNGTSHGGRQRDREGSPCPLEGMVLVDLALNPLAFDRGALSILTDSDQAALEPAWVLNIPKEILQTVNRLKPSDLVHQKIRFHIGGRAFLCHCYLVDAQVEHLPSSLLVLHLSRDVSVADALLDVSSEYHLTTREQEALEGLVMGLSSKEVAERMNISPNTVKAFVRLIMVKMGVSTRAGVVARLLEHNGHG